MNATLNTYLSRAARLQARLAQRREAGDEGGAMVTLGKLEGVGDTLEFLELVPCLACGQPGSHYSWRECRWMCIEESENDL